jgi:hypothetical protein
VNKNARDFDSEFNDPAIWNAASYTPDPCDEIEPLPDVANPYRERALGYLHLLLAVDSFMTTTTDARLVWVGISIALRLTSVRGLTLAAIAGQLGVTEAAESRAAAKFTRLANLDSAGGLPLFGQSRSNGDKPVFPSGKAFRAADFLRRQKPGNTWE